MLFFAGLMFGGLMAYLFADIHYKKRLNKAFWLWVEEQNLKGIIDEEVINELSEEFDEKTKGTITIEKK